MAKLPFVIALAAITALLAGCAGTSSDEPEAASVSTAPTASASADASPSATPSPVATTTASSTPEPEATQEEAAPVETPAVIETPVEAPAEAPLAIATAATWDSAPRVTVVHGSSFTVTSTGYQPGQNVLMLMGIYQTDSTEVDEQSAGADATGSVSFTIAVTPDIDPKTYGVVTMILDGQISGEDREASKRFALVDVVAG